MAETLHFTRSLYAPEAVQEAARAFAHLATLDVSLGEDDVALVATDIDPEVADVLLDELANHALVLTAQARR